MHLASVDLSLEILDDPVRRIGAIGLGKRKPAILRGDGLVLCPQARCLPDLCEMFELSLVAEETLGPSPWI
jgi:hypothetical protein